MDGLTEVRPSRVQIRSQWSSWEAGEKRRRVRDNNHGFKVMRGKLTSTSTSVQLHLGEATAAILCQSAHHTPAEGEGSVLPIESGWLGGWESQGWEFIQDTGGTPDSLWTSHLKDGWPGAVTGGRGTEDGSASAWVCWVPHPVQGLIEGREGPPLWYRNQAVVVQPVDRRRRRCSG